MQLDEENALKTAFVEAEKQLVAVQEIDSTCSGTTAVAVILKGNKMWVANSGDSRAVVASAGEDPDGRLLVTELTEVPQLNLKLVGVNRFVFSGSEAKLAHRGNKDSPDGWLCLQGDQTRVVAGFC